MTAHSPAAAPLTEAQSGLWYAQQIDPSNPIFNTGQYLLFSGDLDVVAFQAAADRMAEEADALALRFSGADDRIAQTVDARLRPRLEIVDMSAAPEPLAAAQAAMRRDMETPVAVTQGPLARQTLYILGRDAAGVRRFAWYLRVHHLAADGYGISLLTRRVAELYNRPGGGRPLAPLDAVFAEDAAYRAAPARDADARYWRAALAAMGEVAGLAPGRAMTARYCHRFDTHVAPRALGALQELARAGGTNWADALTAIVAAYCGRIADAPEAVIGVPFMGRMGSATARVPAMVMNILPLRVPRNEEAAMAAFVAEVAKGLAVARRHGRYRSEQMRRDLGRLGAQRRLYGALVNVLPFDRVPDFSGLTAEAHILGTGPVDDITFTFRGDALQRLTLEVEANPELYTAEETRRHGLRLAAFIAAAAAAQRLADVPTATEEEAAREITFFNDTAHPVPDTTLTALIESGLRRDPAAPALIFDGVTVSHDALDRQSAALAAQLRAKGAGAGSIVAVALPRSIELVVALVGILRAGAAYLPLDPEHPEKRLTAIVESAQPLAVIAPPGQKALFGARFFEPRTATDTALVPPSPGDAAYVIYTSGSTGAPKGVVIEHRAIVNRLLWMQAQYAIGPHDVFLQKTPATFDVSVWEFFLPLIAGATLVVAPPGAHREPPMLARLIRAHGVTTLHFVPSMLAAFLDEPSAKGLSVTRVFCSGEELPAALRDRFHRTLKAELHNLYGPTEAAVDVSYWAAGPDDDSQPVPIGHPVWNTSLLILDSALSPVPPGVTGRLYLGGVQLARGYLGRPDLTAERFIPDPFHPGARLYDTGDLARRRLDGAVVFLGRADHQVKIRGLRIELGEIEAAIADSGLTRAAAVIVREDRADDKRLVAYVVPASGYAADALRAHLAATLPSYMIPGAFVALEQLPVTANGKLDRARLPAPAMATRSGRAVQTATEIAIAHLFREVLGLEREVGAEEDFFELGGDSLLAVRLTLRMNETLGRDPGLGALFEHPTVAGLAGLMDGSGDADDGLGPVIALARAETRRAPLFMMHPAGGLCWGYRGLAHALEPPRKVYGLQSPSLNLAQPIPESISALAAGYAARILQIAPEGPYHLAGWSVGGIIAQEVAIVLRERGHEMGLVALLDAYPADCWRAEPEPDETAALQALLTIAGFDPARHPDLTSREKIVDFLRDSDSPLGNLPRQAIDGVIRTVLSTNRLVRGHYHRRYDGTLTHVRAGLDHQGRNLTAALWAPYAAAIDSLEVPFLHAQLTGPAATAAIAPLLSQRMDS